jgi:hypothetical protein
MYDELNSFLGLIMYELDEILYKQNTIEDSYLLEESRDLIIKIQVKLKWIQTKLKNNELNNIEDINKLNQWIIEFNDVIPTLPYGHCFIAKIICKKNKMMNGEEIEFLSYLEIFLEKLGYYMNSRIYSIK